VRRRLSAETTHWGKGSFWELSSGFHKSQPIVVEIAHIFRRFGLASSEAPGPWTEIVKQMVKSMAMAINNLG
jgi:hypothetical protein